MKVHNDKPSEINQSGFKRFLCESPLSRCTREDGKDLQLGSYHQCYRVDGRLVAIGVLDLLPQAVSGVYFIYHPDFEKWSFGKLSAMREAALTLKGGYKYYYMGYYIHNCIKMRYKGDYKPQYLLDPESYEWSRLDEKLLGLLDQKKYVSLVREQMTDASDIPPDFALPDPKEAADSGRSLLSLGMPGIPKANGLEREIDLDSMLVFLGKRMYCSFDVSKTTLLCIRKVADKL